MPEINDPRLNVVNLYDGFVWRLGKFLRGLPFYDRVNSAILVRRFCADAAAHLAELPREIDVETVNRCNGDCGFCPANAGNDPRKTVYMTEELVRKIAAELGAAGYSGTIAPFINNEPLLDKRIAEIVGIFRKACPAAELVLCTNGISLTPENYFSLFESGLDHLVVNNYNDKRRFTGRIGAALDKILSSGHEKLGDYLARTVILLKNKNEVLNSRAGEAPNKQSAERYAYYQRNSCMYPFRQMSILPDGRVSLCCEDFSGKVTLGNVGTESIRAVWNGPQFRAVREELRNSGRSGLPTCSRCDYGHLGGAKAKTLLKHFVGWFSRI